MSDVILHHYALSPFSEKIRRLLAVKGLPWRAVEQPIMMPKTDLVALTGGYRRIPVMQVGADVYCDTALIARRIEALYPQTETLPASAAGLIAMLEDWADHRFFFQCVPPVIVTLFDQLPPGFLDDRAQMSPTMTKAGMFKAAPQAWGQAQLSLDRLARQLGDKDYLLGDRFTLADAACYNPVWFLKNDPQLFAAVLARPRLAAWFERIERVPDAGITALDPAAALAIARDAEPVSPPPSSVPAGLDYGLGDEVAVVADDYGQEQIAGRVTFIGDEQLTVERQDAALGRVAVHFPRAGYRIIKR
ncbi:MAG: glutathione S-transferase family protein [Gammaproteobacteria bacterium]